ncbi:MAG: 5'-nucleotidase C-terminal domain-containing protein, partial [Pseudomonadota bacterium]
VDLKMASRVTGIDVILGGHTHDAMPAPSVISNKNGKTLVINSGSNTKFLSVLDLDVKHGKVRDFRYKLLPVFSRLINPDPEMARYIDKVRAPFKARLEEKLAVTESLLYRRGNFNGTFDQLIMDAMREVQGSDIAFSPGFRWGTSLLPGDTITMEHLMDQTAITYGTSTLNEMTGIQIKDVLEDIADNLFNPDPYFQQGGDMVRVGGMTYTMDVAESMGKRIQDMRIGNKPLNPNKKYKVAGWASVHRQYPAGQKQIWDVVSEYLRHKKTVRIKEAYIPKLKGAEGNPGLA